MSLLFEEFFVNLPVRNKKTGIFQIFKKGFNIFLNFSEQIS